MATSISERLENLTIEDGEFKRSLEQFLSTEELSAKEISQIHNTLINHSQDKQKSKVLYELVLNDPVWFLKSCHRANDTSASIAIHAIHNNNNNPTALVQSLLSSLRIMMKDGQDSSQQKFYLGVYSSLVSHFKMINPQHMNLFLTFINQDHELQRCVLVLLVQSLQLEKAATCDIIKEYLEVVMEEESLDTQLFLNFVITLELCFPMIPEVIEGIYQSEKTKFHIQTKIANDAVTASHHQEYILKLVSASCIVENCRNFNVTNYYDFLVQGIQSSDSKIQVLACVNLVKLWKFVELEKKSQRTVNTRILADTIISYLKLDDTIDEYIETAIEGLMYLTLYWEVRELIRMDIELIELLLSKLEYQMTSIAPDDKAILNFSFQYGILSILVNLTKSEDINEKTNNRDLRKLATPKQGSDSTKEDQNAIKLFNRELLFENKIVGKITSLKTIKGTTSQNSFSQVIRILYHLSQDQEKKTRTELIKQGGLNIIINYLVNYSEVKREDHSVYSIPNLQDSSIIESRILAIRSLARMLISVDPKIAFTKHDIKTTIPFLKELLGPDISKYQGELVSSSYLNEMTLLDRFEALLAMTNISATASSDLRAYIVRQTFDAYLDSFILDSDNCEIQQAAWELVANLITDPSLLAKFFNINEGENKTMNRKRLDLVVKMLNSANVKLQVVIAGLLVNATEYDMIAEVVTKDNETFDHLRNITSDILINQADQEELILPVSYLLVNLVYAVANLGTEGLTKLSGDTKLKAGCTNVLRTAKTRDVLEPIVEVIKIIQFK